MNKFTKLLLLTIIILLSFSVTFSQKDKTLKKYKQRTLKEITLLNTENSRQILQKAKLEEKNDFISFDLYNSKTKVLFVGNSRPISSDHKELMAVWSRLQNIDKKVLSLYENEFLFKEDEKEYWIPVQKTVAEQIDKEIKPNDAITLFVIDVGGRKASMSKELEWLFLGVAFEK